MSTIDQIWREVSFGLIGPLEPVFSDTEFLSLAEQLGAIQGDLKKSQSNPKVHEKAALAACRLTRHIRFCIDSDTEFSPEFRERLQGHFEGVAGAISASNDNIAQYAENIRHRRKKIFGDLIL